MCCFSGLNSFKIRLKEWFYITQFRKKGDLLRHFQEFTSLLVLTQEFQIQFNISCGSPLIQLALSEESPIKKTYLPLMGPLDT